MINSRQKLVAALKSYSTAYEAESAFIQKFIALLGQPRAFHRDHFPGHMTGSAWIVSEDGTHVLLTHHAKLNRWLQPGGHADGDEDITAVATREAQEETGLESLKLHAPTLFDIDIHPIPQRGETPAHDHYDIRMLFTASMKERVLVSEESHAVAWIPLAEVAEQSGNNQSMLRMAEKTKLLFGAD